MRTAIVLAGGRSSRFGGDKLAAELDGTSVLAATIAAVAEVADGVIVAGPVMPRFAAGAVPIALVQDRGAPFEGPLAALGNVLDAAADPDPATSVAIVVGGDMPRVVPAVLELLLARVAGDASVDAALLAPVARAADPARPARRQVLPIAIRLGPAARAARDAIASGDRSLGSLVDRLRSIEVPADEWLPLDPGASTLLDVDEPADLQRLRAARPR